MSVNVQVRIPERLARMLDSEVEKKVFENRSDAIRTIVEFYEYEKRRSGFFRMLEKRADDIEKGNYVSIEQLEKEMLA